MMNDWLLEIRSWLLEVKSGGFLLRPHFGASPLVRASRPPTPLRGLGERIFMAKVCPSI